jgi:hypothetical protein
VTGQPLAQEAALLIVGAASGNTARQHSRGVGKELKS